jgi:hypothetical protein
MNFSRAYSIFNMNEFGRLPGLPAVGAVNPRRVHRSMKRIGVAHIAIGAADE